MARPISTLFWCTFTLSEAQNTDRECQIKSSSLFQQRLFPALYRFINVQKYKKDGAIFVHTYILTDSVHHWSFEYNNTKFNSLWLWYVLWSLQLSFTALNLHCDSISHFLPFLFCICLSWKQSKTNLRWQTVFIIYLTKIEEHAHWWKWICKCARCSYSWTTDSRRVSSWLRRKRPGLLLSVCSVFSDISNFCIAFVNHGQGV